MPTTTVDLPNPYTPMAWLPSELAERQTLQLYVAVGSLAVLLWDILLHIPQDYTMMTKKRLNISSLVYIIARLSGLAYVLSFVIVETAPIGNCDYIRLVGFLYAVALPFTVLLLVFRVVTLYTNSKYAVAFFGLFWLAFLANSIAASIMVKGMPIGNTPYCAEAMSPTRAILSVIGPIVHDTLIFMATAWAFMKDSNASSKSLLRDGQLYFLATIIFHLFLTILSSIPKSFVTTCTIIPPTFVLVNTMSCHVYRNVRLAMYRDFTVALQAEPSSSDQQHQIGIAFSLRRSRHSTILTQEIDFEAARDDSNFASRDMVQVGLDNAESGNSKESITEKAAV